MPAELQQTVLAPEAQTAPAAQRADATVGQKPGRSVADAASRPRTLLSVQYARGVAAVSVLLFHAFNDANATGYPEQVLQAGVDLFSIQKILGHQSLCTTARYTHVRRSHLQEACRSLDLLPLDQLRQGPAPTLPQKRGRRSKSAKSSAATAPRSSQPADPD